MAIWNLLLNLFMLRHNHGAVQVVWHHLLFLPDTSMCYVVPAVTQKSCPRTLLNPSSSDRHCFFICAVLGMPAVAREYQGMMSSLGN